MFRDEWSLDIFSLVGMGVSSFFAYKGGYAKAKEEIQNQMLIEKRDKEIYELRRRLVELENKEK